jgi:succinyl-CoA synthetase beta subunit
VDLYEHQGKELFARYGIPTGEGRVARTPEEARAGAEALGGGRVVVKAQVLAGGRGKAGGVKVADDPADAEEKTRGILGLDIKGHITRRVWVEKAISIDKEYYFSITFDRGAKANLFMLSTMGGMDIEAVAVDHPDKLARIHLNPAIGLQPYFVRRLLWAAGVPKEEHRAVGALIAKAYEMYLGTDAMLVEVNPLVITAEGDVVAADAKVTIDDNALFRHPDIEEMRDTEAADPQEQMARERHVTYVKLDGTIGILGNGAGLVMSTLDVVDQVGGKPANFLDVGGGADADKIVTALEVILSDPKVEAILFNIFGGITRCDEVAKGILAALEQLTIDVPIVVRLDGTNDVEGRKLLTDAAPANVYPERTMLDAARKVVELAKGR